MVHQDGVDISDSWRQIVINIGRMTKLTNGDPHVPGFVEDLVSCRPGWQIPCPRPSSEIAAQVGDKDPRKL